MGEGSIDAPRADRWVGRVLDETFRVEAPIGEGAMGRVYRAIDLSTGRPVAVKLLHDHLSGDPRVAKRFHREAKAASLLSHPNSLVMLDFGVARDGTLFIAMELLEGEDLQTIVENDAPLRPRRIAALMGQALDALHAAHQAGVIHRDLKPENVVVTRDADGSERVKVCDFGIAKIVETEGRSTAITKDGYVCGTPEYMAPEQAKGEPIDVRADVYAAGVMLYQLLCGRVPFKAETALGLITKHIMDAPPPPASFQPTWGIPRSLAAVALRALAKAPADRYPDAAALREAIDAAVAALGDRADERLGHGSFATEEADAPEELRATEPEDLSREVAREVADGESATVEVESPRRAPTTAEAIERALPRSHATRWVALAIVVTLALGAGAAYLARTTDDAPPSDEAPLEIEPSLPRVAEPAPEQTVRPEPLAPPEPVAPATPEAVVAARPRPVASAATLGRAAFDRGRNHVLRGELAAAVEELGEAARLRPSDAAVHRELGRALVRSGDVTRGVSSYRRYLELAPDAPDRAVIERIIAQHGG